MVKLNDAFRTQYLQTTHNCTVHAHVHGDRLVWQGRSLLVSLNRATCHTVWNCWVFCLCSVHPASITTDAHISTEIVFQYVLYSSFLVFYSYHIATIVFYFDVCVFFPWVYHLLGPKEISLHQPRFFPQIFYNILKSIYMSWDLVLPRSCNLYFNHMDDSSKMEINDCCFEKKNQSKKRNNIIIHSWNIS